MIVPSAVTVFSAMIQGFDQLPLSNGSTLTCSYLKQNIDKASEAELPYLLIKNGPLKTAEWAPFVYQCSWDLSATLKVKSEPGMYDVVLQGVIEDLFAQTTKMKGLYVDIETGAINTFSQKTIDKYRAGGLTSLAFRGGPFLTSVATRPSPHERAYGIADIVFHVEFLSDKDPTATMYGDGESAIGIATLFSVGTIPRAYNTPLADPALDFRYQLPIPAPAADTVAQGRYVGSDTDLPGGFIRTAPPFRDSRAIPSIKGQNPVELVKEINVSPPTATFAHTTTQQLTAIAIHVSGWGEQATLTGTWTSGNPAIATVNAAGLVTGVSAGSVSVTCSYGGATGSAALTLT